MKKLFASALLAASVATASAQVQTLDFKGDLRSTFGLGVGIACLLSGIRQGKICAAGIQGMAQGHDVQTNTMIYAALPEFYAILALVATFLV